MKIKLNKILFISIVLIVTSISNANGQSLKSLSNRKVTGIITLGPTLWAAKNCAAFGPGGNIGILVNNRCLTADFAFHPLGDCKFFGGGVNYLRTDFLKIDIVDVAFGFRLGFWLERNKDFFDSHNSGFVTGPMLQIAFGRKRVSPIIQYSGLFGFGDREEDESAGIDYKVNTVRYGNHIRLGIQDKI